MDTRPLRLSLLTASIMLIASCGGGGSNEGNVTNKGSLNDGGQCAAENPHVQVGEKGYRTGSIDKEKSWIRATFETSYLWYAEVPTVDRSAALYSDASSSEAFMDSLNHYFQALKVTNKDRFSFMETSSVIDNLFQSGIVFGDGIEWAFISTKIPRVLRVISVQAGSPAEKAGIQRGDTLTAINGISIDSNDATEIDTLNEALFSQTEATYAYTFTRKGVALAPVSVKKVSNLVTDPVPLSKVLTVNNKKIGYVVFNDHIGTAEAKLAQTITDFKQQQVDEVVLDMRYNGGGSLYIASELAYMLTGKARTSNKTFAHLNYNDKRQAETAANAFPFYDTDINDNALPSLNLSRVYVLTSDSTCSASEAVINGLRGVNVDVQTIGSTTCGKPYGFSGKSNCGISYFPIEFYITNDKNWGDYASGLPATCAAKDDFEHALGDPNEGQLSAALTKITTGSCAAASMTAQQETPATPTSTSLAFRSPIRNNMYLNHPAKHLS